MKTETLLDYDTPIQIENLMHLSFEMHLILVKNSNIKLD